MIAVRVGMKPAVGHIHCATPVPTPARVSGVAHDGAWLKPFTSGLAT